MNTHTPHTFLPAFAGLSICGLFLSSCGRAPEPSAAKPEPSASPAASVVAIPDEFMAPPPAPVKPVLPRVVFATSAFEITTDQGIQGIGPGEALTFVREEGNDYVVQFGDLIFQKNKTYFADTFVEQVQPASTPVAGEAAAAPEPAPMQGTTESGPAATEDRIPAPGEPATDASMAGPALPGEPPLSGTVPENPQISAENKKIDSLTDTIRGLNDEIRTAQTELDQKSHRTADKGGLSSEEIAKTKRSIKQLKTKRDELSGELTEMGKP
jgi:hypothetical protein